MMIHCRTGAVAFVRQVLYCIDNDSKTEITYRSIGNAAAKMSGYTYKRFRHIMSGGNNACKNNELWIDWIIGIPRNG